MAPLEFRGKASLLTLLGVLGHGLGRVVIARRNQ